MVLFIVECTSKLLDGREPTVHPVVVLLILGKEYLGRVSAVDVAGGDTGDGDTYQSFGHTYVGLGDLQMALSAAGPGGEAVDAMMSG